MLITHSKYDDLSAYFLFQLYSSQFPSELQSPVDMLFRMEIPLGKENVGSTHKAMGTPSRLFAKWQLIEVPWCFLFSRVDFSLGYLWKQVSFWFLAYKLPSGHMPDSRTILNLTVFSHLSQINAISLDLAYTWFSHLTWSCHVHLLCIHDSPHMKPSFVFLEVLNYYVTISFQPGQCQVWRVPVIYLYIIWNFYS